VDVGGGVRGYGEQQYRWQDPQLSAEETYQRGDSAQNRSILHGAVRYGTITAHYLLLLYPDALPYQLASIVWVMENHLHTALRLENIAHVEVT
jgi:hypothetical protein